MIYKSIKHYTKQLKTERPRVNPGAPVVEAIKTMFSKHYSKQLKTERPRVNPGTPVVEAIKTMFYKTLHKTAKDRATTD